MLLLLLSSGLFLGWSLGANDAANVFGTAVATRMVRFRTAAVVCGIFVILGAVFSGAGTTGTLGDLGSVNALGGSFMVALGAALAVLWMTRAGLPVSVSTAVVGGIVGWNLFTGSRTDTGTLAKIITGWALCPILAAVFAAIIYLFVRWLLGRSRLHILELDAGTRLALVVVGAIGAYALGANNIANVVGVFVPALPARSFEVLGLFHVTTAQQLFLVGGIAIAVGVFSYSRRVMMTVGKGLFKLTPVTAFVVVAAEAIVLFLFSSEGLESWFISHHLPPFPLVPVSSSQAVIGAVIGIALAKERGRGMKMPVLAKVLLGWVVTPVIAALITFLGLFFLQNVFSVTVHRPVTYEVSARVATRLAGEGVEVEVPGGMEFATARDLDAALRERTSLDRAERDLVVRFSAVDSLKIDLERMARLDVTLLTPGEIDAIHALAGRTFRHAWELEDALVAESHEWKHRPDARANHLHNKQLDEKLSYVYDAFRVERTNDDR